MKMNIVNGAWRAPVAALIMWPSSDPNIVNRVNQMSRYFLSGNHRVRNMPLFASIGSAEVWIEVLDAHA